MHVKDVRVVFEDPLEPDDIGRYWWRNSDYVIDWRYVYQGFKIRCTISPAGSFFKLLIWIDKKKQKLICVSAYQFLGCLHGCFVKEDGKAYIFSDMISLFLEEFSRSYVIHKFGLPFQLPLPFYSSETDDLEDSALLEFVL